MEIKEYVTPAGKTPFREWLNRMRDLRAKVKILQRLDRLTLGHFIYEKVSMNYAFQKEKGIVFIMAKKPIPLSYYSVEATNTANSKIFKLR